MSDYSQAHLVSFDYSVLAVGERFMEELINKARAMSSTMRAAGIPYAVIGGIAVRAHVAAVDQSALMTTRDIDILMRRSDLERAAAAMAAVGYEYRVVMGTPAFIPQGKEFRDGIHVLVSGEKAKQSSLYPTPNLNESSLIDSAEGFSVIALEDLVFMKLASYRPKDITHLEELVELKMITAAIEGSLPADLRERLEKVKRDKEENRLG